MEFTDKQIINVIKSDKVMKSIKNRIDLEKKYINKLLDVKRLS